MDKMHGLPTNPLTKAEFRDKQHSIAVVGHLAVDTIIHPSFKIPSSAGGSAAAIATAAVQLGVKTSIYSRVGKDFPREWLGVLDRLGIDISNIDISDKKKTLHVTFKYDKNGGLKGIETNDRDLTELKIKALPRAGCIHICSMEPESQIELVKRLKGGDVLSISFSEYFIDDYIKKKLSDIMDWNAIDMVFANEKEANAITNEKKPEQMARKIHDKGVDIAVITQGKKGSLVYNGIDMHSINAGDVKVLDPTGCGDSYIGGFLGEYLISKNIKKAAGMGTYLSSLTAQKKGSWAALLSDARVRF